MRGDSDENGSWNTTCTARRKGRSMVGLPLQAWPNTRSVPPCGNKPSAAKASVDLPEPDSPITASVSPWRSDRSAPLTATNVPLLHQPRQPGSGMG